MKEDAVPLPSAPRVVLAPNAILQPPLSRRGHGPGLIVVIPASYGAYGKNNETLDPEPVEKWAEEGYAIVEVAFDIASSGDSTAVDGVIKNALHGLHSFDKCDDKEKFGILVYGSKSDYAPAFNDTLEAALSAHKEILAAIVYDHWTIHAAKGTLFHLTGRDLVKPTSDAVSKIYSYPEASSPGFIYPSHVDFKVSSAGIAHTRSLTFLKRHLDGPNFDLEQIWEEHTYYEFAERSVAKTMGTMVQEPYVNHVPTITGGIGRDSLTDFYRKHFVFNNPDDTRLELISRTVGVDRIVDEFVVSLTHDKQIDWMVPGIPPTGKPLRVPFTSVVNIRGDRLYHEHISWDQATVLVQLGLMPEYLTFPYPLPDGKLPSPGKRFEFRVPAAGAETAAKLEDGHAVPSNDMLQFSVREVDSTVSHARP